MIDTRLRDPRKDVFTSTLDVSMLQASALIEGPLSESQSFYLAGRMSYMDLLLEDVVEDNEDGIEFVQFPRYTDYQAKYLLQLQEGSRIRVQANGASDEMEVTLASDSKTAQKEPVLIGTHSNDTVYHSQGVVWEAYPGSSATTVAVGHMNSETSAHAAAAGDWEVETDTWYAKGRWTQPLGTDHLLALGGQVTNLNVDYDIDFRDTGCTEFDVNCSYTDSDQFSSNAQVEKVFGNPQLSHFDATHYVAGIEHIGIDGWEWKSEVYYKVIDNLVSSDPLTRYNNSGQGKAAGIELFLSKLRTDRWSGWVSLALSKAERTNTVTGESFPFEYDQPVSVTFVGNYHINDKWEFGAKWWYHSGAPYTPITGSTADPEREDRYIPVYGAINSERMPDYHRLDLRLSRRFSEKSTIYVELINAYAQKNVSGYEYSADYSSRDPIDQLPMLLSFGVTASF